jgi:hypothetical protein
MSESKVELLAAPGISAPVILAASNAVKESYIEDFRHVTPMKIQFMLLKRANL